MIGRATAPIMIVAVLALTVAACGGAGFDEKSGDDAKRGGSAELRLNVPVDDRLDADQGDHTDWKVFALGEAAEVTIRLWWDDPSVEASLTVRNPEARTEFSEAHRPGARRDVIGPMQLPAGKYFVQVQVTDGASVYTLEVLGSASAGAGASGSSDRPDF